MLHLALSYKFKQQRGKDPQSFLKDLRINNINRLIIGQLNINSLRNKFEQLSTMISGNIDMLMISETKLEETFPEAQSLLQGFCMPYRFVFVVVVALWFTLERIYLRNL